jgi:hypothetical protein
MPGFLGSSRTAAVRLVVCGIMCALVISLATCAPGSSPLATTTFSSSPPPPPPGDDYSVSLSLGPATVATSTTVTVELRSTGGKIEGAGLDFTVDGPGGAHTQPMRSLRLEAGQTLTIPFKVTFPSEGYYDLTAAVVAPGGRVHGASIGAHITRAGLTPNAPLPCGPGTPCPAVPVKTRPPFNRRAGGENGAAGTPQSPTGTVTLHGYIEYYDRVNY